MSTPVRAAADRPWVGSPFVYPERIPTMITHEEREYLWWLTAAVWEDKGHIVEMGPWLGGSTACLAAGIRAREEKPNHRLYTIDNFVWRTFMSDRAEVELRPGESFEHAFRENVACYGDLIVATRAWLPDETIPGDRWAEEVRGRGTSGKLFRWHDAPAEIVFVDGAKSWAGLAHFLREVGSSLTESPLLVFQDYKFWGSYWVPMMSELLADRLQLVHVLPANTVAFRVSPPLPIDRIGSLPDTDHGVALLERAASRLRAHGDAAGASIVHLSSVRFLAHRGDADAAADTLRRVARARPPAAPLAQVVAAHRWLESYTGRAVPMPRIRSRTVMQAAKARALRAARKAAATVTG